MSVDASALELGRMKLLSREGESLRELRTEGEREKEGVCVGGGYTASLVGESSTLVWAPVLPSFILVRQPGAALSRQKSNPKLELGRGREAAGRR